jgi:hypothetical protein
MEVGFIILMALAIPIVLIWPLLIWAGALRSIYKSIRAKAKAKAMASQKLS